MAAVLCARPGHNHSKVVLDGLYGTVGHKRQQYRCAPTNGDKPHRFTPVLPRLCAHGDQRCLECEHVIGHDEGPQVPRTYWYSARDIAESLQIVGSSQSYIAAANTVRERADRQWVTPRRHGQLLADWVEVYAPILWGKFGPKRTPEILICDSIPFFVTPTPAPGRRRTRKRKLAKTKAFDVCCVVGASAPKYQPELLALVAVPSVDQAAWETILRQLPPGRPRALLSDEDNSLAKAVAKVWPDDLVTGEVSPEMQMCVWHLARGYREKAAPRIQTMNVAHPVWKALESAFLGPRDWEDFCEIAREDGGIRVDRWLRRLGREKRMAEQLAHLPIGAPKSNKAVEVHLLWLRGRWSERAGSYRNAARTNRLLQLYVLHRRGADDARQYSLAIREHLGRRGGISPPPRQVTERGAKPGPRQRVKSSLRF